MKTKTHKPALFTEKEYQELIVIGAGPGATTEQILTFLRLCEGMKADSILLETIQSGLVKVGSYVNGQPIFVKA